MCAATGGFWGARGPCHLTVAPVARAVRLLSLAM